MSKAAITLLALVCRWCPETENEWFRDDPYDTTDPNISWSIDEPEPSPSDMSDTDIFRGPEAGVGVVVICYLLICEGC